MTGHPAIILAAIGIAPPPSHLLDDVDLGGDAGFAQRFAESTTSPRVVLNEKDSYRGLGSVGIALQGFGP